MHIRIIPKSVLAVIFSAICCFSPRSSAEETGLILYHNYDVNSTEVADLSGNNNTGTVYGSAVWTSEGKVNGAYTYDGTNDCILVPDASCLCRGGLAARRCSTTNTVESEGGICTVRPI